MLSLRPPPFMVRRETPKMPARRVHRPSRTERRAYLYPARAPREPVQRAVTRWYWVSRTMRATSSKPGCPRDQDHPRPDDDGADGARDALAGRCEAFGGDGCRHDRHRAQVYDTDNQ